MRNKYLRIKTKFVFIAALMISLSSAYGQAVTTLTFAYTGTMQTFTVPTLCVNQLTIEARGAQGGSSSGTGGNGARMRGTFTVTPGQVLSILTGQCPGNVSVGGYNYPAGGGGSFVGLGAFATATPMIVAGGGGGGHNSNTGDAAPVTTSGTGSSPGTNGNGAPQSNCGGSGGGFFTSGANDALYGFIGGSGFQQGGAGGTAATGYSGYQPGGFGGGAPANYVGSCNLRAGAGGGYSGGSGYGTSLYDIGSAGGSYNNGTNQTNNAGFQTGHGVVYISYISGNAIAVSASPSVICTGGSAILTASGVSSYTWSTGPNTTTVSVSPLTNTTYTVSGSDAAGCVSSRTISIPVNTIVPTLTVATSASSVCATKPVTLTATGALTYTWTNGVTNAVSYTPSATNDYTVTGANACGTSTAAISVTVLTLPTIVANASNTLICSGTTLVLSGSGGTGNYTWTPNIANNVIFNPSSTVSYTVRGAAANNCTNSAVVQVVVINNPTVAPIASPTAICVGSTVNLSAVGATGYSWTAVNWAGSNASVTAVTPTITTTYSLTRVNGICTTSATINVVVNNFPILSLSPATTVCACTGSANLTVVGGITATWMPSGAQGNNLVVYPCVSTNYSVSASSSQGCISTSVIPITVAPNPVIVISASSPSICAGGTVALSATGAPTFSWTRSIVLNQFTSAGNTSAILDNPPTNAQYFAAGTSTDGCTTSAGTVIVVRENPTLTVSSSAPYACNGNSTTLTASNGPGAPATTYSWSTNQIAPSIVVSPVATTNYSVRATYTTGCSTSSVFPLAVYIATFAVNTPSAICQGSTYTLTATGGASTFTWGTSPVQTGSMAVVSPTTTTTYTVRGAAGQCSVMNTVVMNVNPLPPVNISSPKWVVCLFDEIQLTANGASTYSWTNPDGTFDTNPSITFAVTGNGGPNGNPTQTTSFTLTGVDVNGCAKTVVSTVYVTNCTGIDEQGASASALNVYPNPNNGEFVIKSDMPMQLTIINELGQTVKHVDITENTTEVNVSGLANGVYFISGQSNGKRIATKLVVNK